MAYQINALFDDGHLLMSEILDETTPHLGDEIEFWRDGHPVIGVVKKITARRVVALHGPTHIIDEVHFSEVVEETRDGSDRPFLRLWKSIEVAFATTAS